MQLKLFFLAFVLGFAASRPAVKNIIVSPDGSYIEITSDLGTRVEIIKNRYEGAYGLKDFEIVLTGPNFYKDVRMQNQIGGDVIFDLFRRYDGVVDDVTFEKIIYKLEQYSQQGEINPQVFHMILALHDPTYVELFAQENAYGQYYQGLYGKSYNNVLGLGSYGPSYYGQRYYGQQYSGPSYYGQNYGPSYYGKSSHGPSYYGQSSYGPSYYGQSSYGPSYYGQSYYGPSSYGKSYYGPGYYGQNYYGSKYYGQNYYGQNYYGQNSYYPSVYSQDYTPSIWNQILNKYSTPYYGGAYNYYGQGIKEGQLGYGLNQYSGLGYSGDFWSQLQSGSSYNRYSPVNSYNYLYNSQTPYYNSLYNSVY